MEIQRVQFAFKDSMIHIILQFTLLIATGHVLHRYTSLEIHRQQLLLHLLGLSHVWLLTPLMLDYYSFKDIQRLSAYKRV